jgi:hypothetical protein
MNSTNTTINFIRQTTEPPTIHHGNSTKICSSHNLENCNNLLIFLLVAISIMLCCVIYNCLCKNRNKIYIIK